MDKKVGIVSCYFKKNYGSMLQAYATQKILDDNQIENETIDISDLVDFKKGKRKYYLTQITNFGFIKTKFGMVKLKAQQKLNKKLGENFRIRNKKFTEFERIFKLSRTFNTYKDISDYSKERYSDVIVGSDQLWLPVNIVADYYTLNWVPEDVNKISYATSFGISTIPEKYKSDYERFLKRIENISVRETNGVDLVKELSGKTAKLVCDPTLLLDKEQWMEIQQKERLVEDKYIFCYFLGNNIEHRKFVERLKDKTGFKIVSLNHCDEFVKYSDKFADIIPYDVGPAEFVNYIRNAEYVCTDSFHGTIFSLINNVKFYTFERFSKKTKMSTNSRIHSLLKLLNLESRLLKGTENVVDVLTDIDFLEPNKIISDLRKESLEWLLKSVKYEKKKEYKHIVVENKENCTGCTACKSTCPKHAIEMVEDEEGFLYPKVDLEKCVDCGLCKKACPVLNSKDNKINQKGFVLNNKDEGIRADSTSGGAFTPIANYVLDNKGVVFGAAFDSNYKVIHTYIENKNDIHIFRGSKYVQSYLGDSFIKVKEFLKDGRMVCFSGTPCQIEGLKKYLEKDYDKLITVDVMCHAVPSPLVLRKYISFIKKYKLKNEKIEKILFRDKSKFGFKYSMMTLKSKNYTYSKGVDTDPYLRAFFGDLSDRPSCYKCAFKKKYHISDFTIWDCFVAEKFEKSLDDDKGTSRMLINSLKGIEIFKQINDNYKFKEIEVDFLTENVKEMLHSVNLPIKRKSFFEDINKMEEDEFFKKYFPDSIKVKLERTIRVFLAKTGLYKKIKSLVKGILRK